jgi:hypothetical protein
MDCLHYKDQLTDAALGSLASQHELSTHLDACTACAAELARVRLLLSAIDRGVEASVRAEPSPEMMARFRRRIAEEPAPHVEIGMWVPVAAALAVTVAAFLWLGIRPGLRRIAPASSHEAAVKSTPAQPPRRAEAGAASANVAPPVASHSGASRALKPAGRLDVLVPPGQMAAALQLQAALRNGRVDPSSVVADADKEELGEPLDIARLKIPPLEFPKLDAGEEHPQDSVNR